MGIGKQLNPSCMQSADGYISPVLVLGYWKLWLELFLQDEVRHDFLCTKKEINKIRDDCTLLALVLDLV